MNFEAVRYWFMVRGFEDVIGFYIGQFILLIVSCQLSGFRRLCAICIKESGRRLGNRARQPVRIQLVGQFHIAWFMKTLIMLGGHRFGLNDFRPAFAQRFPAFIAKAGICWKQISMYKFLFMQSGDLRLGVRIIANDKVGM